MRLDKMVMNWFMARLRSTKMVRWPASKNVEWNCFCCKGESETSMYGFQEAMRAWTPLVEWAPLGVHILIFVVFGAPLLEHGRVDSEFWACGLALYVCGEITAELMLRMYERA